MNTPATHVFGRSSLRAASLAAVVVASLSPSWACTRVADEDYYEDDSTLILEDASADVPYFDIAKDVKKDIASDAVATVPEQCGNQKDDDGDGLIDESGCYPQPNLRAGMTFTDLGVVPIAAEVGPAPTRTLDVALKNQGLVWVAEDLSDGDKQYVWGESLLSPTGIAYVSPGLWEAAANRGFVELGHATMLVGMSPQISVVAGPWKAGFVRAGTMPLQYAGKPTAGLLRLSGVSRPPLAANQKGRLDLDVFCVGGAPMPCNALAKSPQWQQIVARINSIWSTAQVELGTVQLLDLGGDSGKAFRFLDNVESASSSNELNQVYQATGALRPASTAVTLVLVSAISGSTTSVAGLSKLAGVPGWAGSRLSGMAVAIDDTMWQKAQAEGPAATVAADVWGTTIAHEIGHFLGLWHTDEFDGVLKDTVDDTPPCAPESASISSAACPVQAKYLMFPQVTATSVTITNGQAKVARLSPALR